MYVVGREMVGAEEGYWMEAGHSRNEWAKMWAGQGCSARFFWT
jgi:hypothetical protein